VLCDHRGESHARAIKVLATGRIRTLTLTDIEESDRPSDCEEGTGPDKKGAKAEKALQHFLATHNVRTFNTNKNGMPKQPKKTKGKKWNNKFERGVYFDELLDWQKSTGKGNQKNTKKKRKNNFKPKKTNPAIVKEYIRLKEATGTPYIR